MRARHRGKAIAAVRARPTTPMVSAVPTTHEAGEKLAGKTMCALRKDEEYGGCHSAAHDG
jgi:hypothetical protein